MKTSAPAAQTLTLETRNPLFNRGPEEVEQGFGGFLRDPEGTLAPNVGGLKKWIRVLGILDKGP